MLFSHQLGPLARVSLPFFFVVVPVVVAIWDYYGFLVCRDGLYFFQSLISHIPGRICDHLQYFGLALLRFGYM
jgi:hypothetical protein